MVFDNGQNSHFQNPPGDQREFASPRKYTLDLVAKVATEVWNYPDEPEHPLSILLEASMRMRRTTI